MATIDDIDIIELGEQGPIGQGVPSGGTTGQFLQKVDGTDYNTQWTDSTATIALINDIGNVNATPTDGQALVWNQTAGEWQASDVASSGGTWGSITGTLSSQTDLQAALDAKSNTTHNHTGVYAPASHTHVEADITDLDKYTQAQVDTALAGKSDSSHSHALTDLSNVNAPLPSDGEALVWNNVAGEWQNQAAAPAVHTHDDRYYTETEVDTLLSGKSDTTHNHDASYAALSHNHDADYAALSHTHAANDLSDVVITTPADNEVLAYDTTSGNWINQTPAEAGLADATHNHTGVYAPVSHTHVKADITDADWITAVVDDSTPQLGGALDTQGFAINGGVGAGDFIIDKAGSGNLVIQRAGGAGGIIINGLTIPADGLNGQVMYTNGAGQLGFKTVAEDGHTHDDRYYTETEVDTLLSGKSDTSHTHFYALDSLIDVTITGPIADGEVLQFNTVAGEWINQTLAEAGIASSTHDHSGVYAPVSHTHVEADITDLDKYTQAQVDTALAGKSDTSHTHALNDLSNVNAPTPTDGQSLVWNNTAGQWQSATATADIPFYPTDGWTRETTTTTGTADVVLAGAGAGFLTFADTVGFDKKFSYHIKSGTDYEVGVGFIASPAPTAHRYWRLNVTNTIGGTGFKSLGEFQLYETVSGPNVSQLGTVTLTNISGTPSDVTDSNHATGVSQTFGGDLWNVKVDFGAGNEKAIQEYGVGSYNGNEGWSPSDWTLEWSDNDVDWNVADTKANITTWTTDDLKKYSGWASLTGGDTMERTAVIRSSNADAKIVLAGTSEVSAAIVPENTIHELAEIYDVDLTGKTDGDYLAYDQATDSWVSTTPNITDPRMATSTIAVNPSVSGLNCIAIGDDVNLATNANVVVSSGVRTGFNGGIGAHNTIFGIPQQDQYYENEDYVSVFGAQNHVMLGDDQTVIGNRNQIFGLSANNICIGSQNYGSVLQSTIYIGNGWNMDQNATRNVLIGWEGAYLDHLDDSFIIGNTPTFPTAPAVGSVHWGHFCLFGDELKVTGAYSGAEGYRALSRDSGHKAHSFQPFNTTTAHGDSQTSQIIMKVETTDATVTELLTHGDGYLEMADDTTIMYEVHLVARRTDAQNESAAYRFTFVADRQTGVATVGILGDAVQEDYRQEDNAAWNYEVTADTTNGRPKITVQGEAAKTVRWTAFVRTTEVANS